MTIHLRTEIKVYCDGAVHRGLESVAHGKTPMTEARALMRQAGWTVTSDGNTYCPEHKPTTALPTNRTYRRFP